MNAEIIPVQKESNIHFRRAGAEELSQIYELYQSVIGSAFCVWNENYPGLQELNHDFETGNLYVLVQNAEGEDSPVVGAMSVVPENEMDHFAFWKCKEASVRELARIAVAPRWQGLGLSGEMVRRAAMFLGSQGCPAVHLSVVKTNLPACKTYEKLGFAVVGEADMYGHGYYLMEKIIDGAE